VFYISYFSYYLMITGCGLALFLQGRQQFFHYISLVSLVFYACFLVYIFLPVVGPRIFYRELGDFGLPAAVLPAHVPEFPAAVQEGLFYQIMALIYRHFETPGAAFPSSHVAVAVTTLYFSFRYLPAIRWMHAVVVVLLCLSTVYCRYHYAVDVPAGLVMAWVMIGVGNWLMGRVEGPEAVGRAGEGQVGKNLEKNL
jgi:membrane-associated phospholipid phosphatase